MAGKRFKPMEQTELFEQLNIPEIHHKECKKIITDLLKEELIEVHHKKISLPKPKEDVITGILRVHAKGFGFVIPDHPALCPQDVFIPKHLTDGAVDGDHVEVQIHPDSQSEKGPEGKITAILKRARSHLAGTIRSVSHTGEITAYAPILGITKPVFVKPTPERTLHVGDRVILHVDTWGTEREPTRCHVTHVIGHITDPSCDIKAAAEEFDIRCDFSKSVIDQAKAFGKKVLVKEQKKRIDLTSLETFTIDPDTAKDFDDALSLTKDRKGIYHLAVHIADVAHYVKAGTPLDDEAILRSNSTYFPGSCIPMLPEELSNHLCSLKPDVIRLTVSVLMDFDKTGSLLKHEVVRSFIHSDHRFTYFEALDIIEGKKKSPHAKTLKLMVELCKLLKQKRHERGSIDFALPEMVILVDEKGKPTGLKKIEYDITHQLVEEFMLKANEVVARTLTERGKTVIYRVHEEPNPENFEDFLGYARSLGLKVPLKPSSSDLQQLFEDAKKTPYMQQLSIAFIRSMKLAQYSSDNIGHFGLALEHYCHFTSPIRRYSDLVTQRLLFNEEPEDLNIEQISLHCSEQERVSFRAETSVKTLKKLRLLQAAYDEDPNCEYEATVTRIKPFGFFFELKELMLEGFLHISELDNDYFIYDQNRNLLYGRSSGKTYTLGNKLKVRLQRIDLIVMESQWCLATAHPRSSSQRSSRSDKKKRRR
ncbi:MAG: ribonuclease R [Rhabdochlamydiaceae bacterium]|nr:ribonuclease R [Rhabdochlamydiaceae bacterium]